ncbi:MAG: ATP-dependent helicase [Flavisolibacter sp.]|nr:ATP-dependent helicase [Flavisolibacter sp.]
MSLQHEKLLQKFTTEYNRLNERQRQAVDQIEGPVLVIAGPGTGKTQILSIRIAKILLETDYRPSNILCLTYTDAGVLAMRKRLLEMIGPDAYTVQLHSFHSFCNMVIQQNTHLFHKKDLQPLNELEQWQGLIQLIDALPNEHPLKRYKTDAYFEARYLKDLFSTMKREGWTTEYLTAKIDEYIEEGIQQNFYNKVKFKKGIVEITAEGKKEKEKMLRLRAAVELFPQYQAMLLGMQRYDFDDMINWVVKAFETNNDLLLGYQEQYQFVLVDEYQDTSGLQNKLVELLISYWQDENPNLFVVGDDDQSIYRFQGANMENMLLLSKKYEKDIRRVVLTHNYRSVQAILNAAHQLIQNNQRRICNEYTDVEKVLTAARDEYKELRIAPVVRTLNNEFEENILVAEEIRQLIDEGIQPGRIAVIYKEHKSGDELQKFLQLQKVSYYTRRSVNLLHEPLIKKIISFIEYVVAETEISFSGEPTLFTILHYHFYNIPALRIATLCSSLNENRRSKKEPVHLRTCLAQLAAQKKGKLFTDDIVTDQLIQVHEALEKLITESKNLPLLRWIELMLNEMLILSYILQQPDKAGLMQQLNGFFDYLQDECRRNKDIHLKGLLRQIKVLEENNIPVSLVQTNGTENGVNLLTCHGSKGLEYEYVFLIGCCSDVWEGKKKFSNGYKLPPNVFQKESPEEKEEELRRLFFVAATRAEKHLYISFPCYTNEGQSLEGSRFIAEMNAEGHLQSKAVTIPEEVKLKYSALRYGMVQQPELEKAEEEFIKGLLESFTMNVTALNNYLECPLKFYYWTLLRVPGARSESAQFGSSMHDALNHYYSRMMDEKAYPPKEVLLSRFQWHLYNNREVFTLEGLKRYTDYGKQCLDAFYEKFFVAGCPADFIRTEVPIEAVIQQIPVKGFADKIQYWGHEVAVTDFKTGSKKKAHSRHEFAESGHPKKPEGGNYWRQAVFYKLLLDHAPGKKKVLRSIEFLFIEPNEEQEFDRVLINITTDHERAVLEQFKEVWEKIQQHDFYTGCGKPECEWCRFVKEHKLYTTLHEVEEEPVYTLTAV